MGNGWICLNRGLLDHWLWNEKPFSHGQAWIDLLLLANHKDKKELSGGSLRLFYKGTVNRSITELAERWGWDRKKVRRFLSVLQSDDMVTVNGTTHGTTVTIVNYSKFQDRGTTEGTTTSPTTPQPLPQQLPTNNNDNNINNDNKERGELPPVRVSRYPAGRYQNVFLSAEEAAKIQKEYPGEADQMIEKLSEYMQTHKTSYKEDGHYALLCKWIREDRKKQAAEKPKKDPGYGQHGYTEAEISAIEKRKLGLI